MLVFRIAVPLTVLGVSVGSLISPATSAAAAGDNTVSRAEYAAVERGMTPRQVTRVTHGARFVRLPDERCPTRLYDGWNRAHGTVAIVFDSHKRVQAKVTAKGGGGVLLTPCP